MDNKKKHTSKFKKIFSCTFLCIFLISIGIFIRYFPTLASLYADSESKIRNINESTFRNNESSFIYDKNGAIIDKLHGSKDILYVQYKDIPNNFKNAFISTEDKNFLKHKGVDIKANLRAIYHLVKNHGKVTQGASTITQQLSRNVFLTQNVNYQRKIEEIFISIQLEKKYTKEQILEYYLNSIYFSNGAYGIEAASKKYFNTDIKNLNLAQTAFLVAIPNNPTIYDPFKNIDNTLKRKNFILSQMLEDGKITQEQYDEAVKTKITLNPEKIQVNNYIETYTMDCAAKALIESKGFSLNENTSKDEYDLFKADMEKELYTNGYRIYTSIDMNKQKILQNSVDSTLKSFTEKSNNMYALQGASVCINNDTGLVEAISGGRTDDSGRYTLNRAFQSYRQPGSTIKPIAVYTPAFQKGYTPSSRIEDKLVDGGPHNDDNKYSGMLTLKKAVEQSTNTVAWNLMDKIGVKYGLSFLPKMNFDKIDEKDYNLAAALGGLTYGVTPVQMASGYSTLERNGKFINPTCITKITDSQGKVIYENKHVQTAIYNPGAASTMTQLLENVMKNGTGTKQKLSNMPSAGKTGTTEDHKDGWFVGYTPYFTTAVWVGYDTPKSIDNLWGSTYPGNIWETFMSQIHKDLPYKDFINVPLESSDDNMDNNSSDTSNAVAPPKDVNQDAINIIESKLEILENLNVNTIKDVNSALKQVSILQKSIDNLTDDTKKSEFSKRLNVRYEYLVRLKDSMNTSNTNNNGNNTKNSTNNNTINKTPNNNNDNNNTTQNSSIKTNDTENNKTLRQ